MLSQSAAISSQGLSESVAATAEISKSVGTVESAARATRESAGGVNAAGQQLHGLAGRMNDLVRQFKVD